MTSKLKVCRITNGPSREELFDSLRLSGEFRPIIITCIDEAGISKRVVAETSSIAAVPDFRGGSVLNTWNITGLSLVDGKKKKVDSIIHVRLNTMDRTGQITFEEVPL